MAASSGAKGGHLSFVWSMSLIWRAPLACPWYCSMILSIRGANVVYESCDPAYTPIPESVFWHPERMACRKLTPDVSFLSLSWSQRSLDRHLLRSDFVPGGKTGNPVISSGFFKLGPHLVSSSYLAAAGCWAGAAPPPSSFSLAIIALTPLYMSCTNSTSDRPSLLLFEMS